MSVVRVKVVRMMTLLLVSSMLQVHVYFLDRGLTRARRTSRSRVRPREAARGRVRPHAASGGVCGRVRPLEGSEGSLSIGYPL